MIADIHIQATNILNVNINMNVNIGGPITRSLFFDEGADLNNRLMVVHPSPYLGKKRATNNAFISCDAHSHFDEGPSPTKKRRRFRKAVRFCEYVEILALDNHNHSHSHSLSDRSTCWYQRHELASFKQDSKAAIHALHAVHGDFSQLDQNNSQQCLRGLEYVLSPTAAHEQRKARKERVAAVLYQQRIQKEMELANPEFLRMISCMMSEVKCEEARLLAAQDSQIWNQM
jgi:hypothetical protein